MSLPHNVHATEASRINLLNNGGFTGFNSGIEARLEAHTSAYTVVDVRQYSRVSYSFQVPSAAGSENLLGYWDVYGAESFAEVSPVDSEGRVLTPLDGGNLVKLSFVSGGDVTFEQALTNLAGCRGDNIAVAFSGRKFSGDVNCTIQLVINNEVYRSVSARSSTFGLFRRVSLSTDVPFDASTASIRFVFSGTAGSAVGLSGLTAYQGSAGFAAYAPSLADRAIPAGTVILYTGDSCPAGFRDASEGEETVYLAVSGPAAISQSSTLVFEGGEDTHDHNPNSPTGIVEASDSQHETDNVATQSTKLFQTKNFADVTSQPAEQPIAAAGLGHTHKVASDMTSIPPSFQARACVKL